MSRKWHFVSAPRLPFLNYILPPLTIIAAQFFEALPGTLFSGAMPFMGPIVLFYWGLYRPRLVPIWQVFFLGLVSDVFFSPLIGIHGLIYLIVRQTAVAQRRYLAMRNFTIVWVTFCTLMGGIFLAHSFYMTSVGFAQDPFIFTKLTQTCFAFPLLYYVLARAHRHLLYEGWL